jgi:hypothetical protein
MIHHKNTSRTIAMLLLLPLLLLFTIVANAKIPISKQQLPEQLKPWVEWVVYDQEEKLCPFIYNQGQRHQCAWPSHITLDLASSGGQFQQSWQVFQESWIQLPGDERHWPQDVTVNDQTAVITKRNQLPYLKLKAGVYKISGKFPWRELPEFLTLPSTTGLIELKVDHKKIEFPNLNQQGKLWLQKTQEITEENKQDRQSLQVFRKISDEIPMQVSTRIELEISGKARELILGPVLLPDFIPTRLTSRLPARLEPDGTLRIQVRPGTWFVEIHARHPQELTSLTLSPATQLWVDEEIWAFDSRNELRIVEIEGATSVDPRQTNLPSQWKHLPAYQMKAEQALTLNVKKRGDPEPAPNRLSLERTLWLDFDGNGYTINDRINGTMNSAWRLAMLDGYSLGRAAVNGNDQLITKINDTEGEGIEIRQGSLNLTSDSRYEGAHTHLPIVGWDHDFQKVTYSFNLPPGWRLLATTGVDSVPNTWVNKWTLLDIFLVLITVLAIHHLWGMKWAALSFVTLLLTWHEPGAPTMAWLNLVAILALLRVIPPGRLFKAASFYRYLSITVLVLITVPYIVDAVRIGLYPQLERPWQMQYQQVTPVAVLQAPLEEQRMKRKSEGVADILMDEAMEMKSMAKDVSKLRYSRPSVPASYRALVPDAKVQTGPGLPRWNWTQIHLGWNGPVTKNQTMGLILTSPTINMLWQFLSVILITILAAHLIGVQYHRGKGIRLASLKVSSLVMFLCAMPLIPTDDVMAEIPSNELLKELRGRILVTPECLPSCAQLSRMHFQADTNNITMRLEVHASEGVSIPLPASAKQWLPHTILLNGNTASGISRDNSGSLWLQVPQGHHEVLLKGAIKPVDSLQIPLPLKPHHVDVSVSDWDLKGIDDEGIAESSVHLTRLKSSAAQKEILQLETGTLPSMLEVERTLHLGLEWHVETRVRRLTPIGSTVAIEVPLLPGESVLTVEGAKVENNKVQIHMGANQREFHWMSVLEKSEQITLTASNTQDWLERWYLNVSPIWRVTQTSGISVVHHQSANGSWLPEWRPWPGEQVELSVIRPQAIEGQTMTIDASKLQVSPGRRATDVNLTLNLRSSLGDQYEVTLPEGAELQSVTINNQTQPIRQQDGKVTLPVTPGSHTINLAWRHSSGLTWLLKTPLASLGLESVNTDIEVSIPRDRWVLYAGGPKLGPAVLFWGVLIVIVLISIGLGRTRITPLKTHHWLLLGIGLSQVPVWSAMVVVGWLFALAYRSKIKEDIDNSTFNTYQFVLTILTLSSLLVLILAIESGLLGLPDMQIAGNGSNAYHLRWYQDQSLDALPQAWVISVPLFVYRLLMLFWSLWLAMAMLSWMRWGWKCFTTHGMWRSVELIKPSTKGWGRKKKKEESLDIDLDLEMPSKDGGTESDQKEKE